MSEKPDYEFDGYLHTQNGRNFLCDIQVSLPHAPSSDAKVQVVVMGVNSKGLPQGDLLCLTSNEAVEAQGLIFKAQEVLIRRATSQLVRRSAGGTKLEIAHIGSWTFERRLSADATDIDDTGSDTENQVVKSVDLLLSSLNYAMPQVAETVDYKGNRTIKELSPPRTLLFKNSSDEILCAWELQRHWHWTRSTPDEISTTSFPVLHLIDSKNSSTTALGREDIVLAGDDSCILLTLAARHRVVVHTINSFYAFTHIQEWRNPLKRLRAVTEEEACGPLIGNEELEHYFEHATRWWSGLTDIQKDSVRLAIFAINPLSESTMESRFLNMFSALEGLTKRWGKGEKFCPRFSAIIQAHPIQITGLWSVCESTGGKNLYWLRNELAHGRSVMRFAPGVLPLATDHLQLWLEYVLLSLMNYRKKPNFRDWLSQQVPMRREDINRLRQILCEQTRGSNCAIGD